METLNSKLREQQALYKRLTSLLDSKTNKVIEERVKTQELTKAKTQEARESLGLVGAYEKIIRARDEAKNKLSNLISAEEADVNAIEQAKKEYQSLNERVLLINKTLKERTNLIKEQTIKENVQNQQFTKVKKQQVREELGLVGAYERLNRKRGEAQKRLMNLLAAEKADTDAIKKAQREYKILNDRIKKVDEATNVYTKNIGNYRSSLKGLSASFSSLLSAFGLYTGIYAFVRVMRNGTKIMRDFEKQNATLAAVLQVEKSEIKDLITNAEELGRTTVRNASEITKLQIAYARLGFSQKQIIDLTKPTVNGSIALNAELSRTAELTGAVIKSFNDFSTTDAPRILDVMALASAKTALTFEKLDVALPIVQKTADQVGVSFERLVAILGQFANAGIRASESARALRRIFVDSQKEGIGQEEIINRIRASYNKLAAAYEAVGIRASTTALVWTNNTKNVEKLTKVLENARGTVDKMAAKELDTLWGSLRILYSAWQDVILKTDEAIGVTDKLKGIFFSLARNLRTIVKIIGSAAIAFVSYKAAIIAVNIAQRAAIAVSIAWRTALTAVNTGLLTTIRSLKIARAALIRTGIGVAVAALGELYFWLTKSKGAYDELAEAEKEANERIIAVKSELELQTKIAQDNSLSLEVRKAAIDKLNKIAPTYLGNLTLETIGTYKATGAIEKYIQAIGDRNSIESLKNKRSKLTQELQDKENKSIYSYSIFSTRAAKILYNKTSPAYAALAQKKRDDLKLTRQEIKAIDDKIKKLAEQEQATKPKKSKARDDLEEAKRLSKAEFILTRGTYKQQIRILNAIANKRSESLKKRLSASKEASAIERRLALLERDRVLGDIKSTDEAKVQARQTYADRINEINRAQADNEVKITIETAAKELNIWKNTHLTRIQQNKFLNDGTYKAEKDRLAALQKQEEDFQKLRYDEGLISEKEYRGNLNVIHKNYLDNLAALDDKKHQADNVKRALDLANEKVAEIARIESLYGPESAPFKRQIELIQAQEDYKIQTLEEQRATELQESEKTGADKQKITQKYAALEELAHKDAARRIKRIYREMHNAILLGWANLIGSIGELFGENTAAAKAAAVAQATINSYVAFTKALSSLPPPFSFIQAALALSAGLAQVKKILDVKVERTKQPEKTRTYALKQTPRAAKGGEARGIVKGKSHAQGGVPAIVNGEYPLELEGEERIMSKKANKKWGGLLRMIEKDASSLPLNYSPPFYYQMGGNVPRVQSIQKLEIDYDLLARKIGEQTAAANAEVLPEALPNPIVRVIDIEEGQDNQAQVTNRIT